MYFLLTFLSELLYFVLFGAVMFGGIMAGKALRKRKDMKTQA